MIEFIGKLIIVVVLVVTFVGGFSAGFYVIWFLWDLLMQAIFW